MAFTLETIIPWGRSFDEYVAMFALTSNDLEGRILGCGDGPASFNAAMHRRACPIVSVDPLYAFSADEIRQRIDDVYPTVMEQLLANRSAYMWTVIASPDDLGRVRMTAMSDFLADYPQGKSDGRYLPHCLPKLGLADKAFRLALCSHLLFTYSDQLSAEFHLRSAMEMCRVADEVRIFPLLEMSGRRSPHVEPVCNDLRQQGYDCRIETVDYEFQRRGNEMLRVRRATHP